MRTEFPAAAVVERLKAAGKTVVTAESCTGGGIGQALTAIPGSSAVYLGGVISYTNAVKHAVLGVSDKLLEEKGAVSAETAMAMAVGVRKLLKADYGISVTGLAGPDGDGSGKSVGLVYIGLASASGVRVEAFRFSGHRQSIRAQAVCAALELLSSELE